MTNTLDISGVSRRFGTTLSLDNVTLSVPTGSICGLFGHNGAGKTTLLSLIAGQDTPDSGEIRVHGHTPFEHGDTLQLISYIRDNQRYPDDYRIHHILRIAPVFYPHWDAELAQRLVTEFALPAKTVLKKYSRGQLSAVAIIIGLASRATLTLFDEPYLGLDVAARELFYRTLIEDIAAHPRTVLLSTHLIQEAEALFTHVVILNHGRVVLEAPRDELWEYATTVTGARVAVEALVLDGAILAETGTGALLSRTVRGQLSSAQEAEAQRLGLITAAVTLQELVAAISTAHSAADLATIGR